MSLYAVDVTFTNPDGIARRKLYALPTNFVQRFSILEKQLEKNDLSIRANLCLTDEQKDKLLAAAKEEYDAAVLEEPVSEATKVSASIMTGKTHYFRRYDTIADLEMELAKPYQAYSGSEIHA